VLLAGTTGNRVNELFTLTDDRVDLVGRTLTISADLCKERRTKVITATNLMRGAGMPVELAADRLGHADGGALLLRTYRDVRAGETRAALDAIGHGLSAAALTVDEEEALRPFARSAAPDRHGGFRDAVWTKRGRSPSTFAGTPFTERDSGSGRNLAVRKPAAGDRRAVSDRLSQPAASLASVVPRSASCDVGWKHAGGCCWSRDRRSRSSDSA
jgi:hypothetical protein